MLSDRRNRYRIGVLVPYTNTNLEPDMGLMCPHGMSIHTTRIAGYDSDVVPGLDQMKQMGTASVSEALKLLKPIKPDAMLYGCTSATLSLGWTADLDFASQLGAMAGCPAITTSGAIIEALRQLDAKKIMLVTPYDTELTNAGAAFLQSAGFNILSVNHPREDLNSREQGAMKPEQIIALCKSGNHLTVDAIVMTCTDLRALECIDEVEKLTGKRVVTSNQALFWCALRVLGIPTTSVPGRLGSLAAT